MSRNVVLVTVDSLRADHCGLLTDGGPGDERALTPTLDSLGDDSLIFEQAFAPGPRTPSSIPTIFTGEFYRPTDLGVYANWEQKSTRWQARRRRIGAHLARFRPLAERMQAAGYETAAVTANPWTTPDTNFDRGFDRFHSIDGSESSSRPWHLRVADRLGDAVGIDWREFLLTWTDFYDTILRTRESLTEPYFLWVFLMDPHQPYFASRRHREETTTLGMLYGNTRYNYLHTYTEDLPRGVDRCLRRAYRDAVRAVDAFLGRYRRDFAGDKPVTVFHADHGEAFQEHGTLGHRPQLYRENVHVPLIVHGTDSVGRVADPVSLRRLPQLVTAVSDGGPVELGRFTRKFVRSKTEENERVGLRGTSWAYQTSADNWEYVHDSDETELFWLPDDPNEQVNVAGEYPDVAESFAGLVERHEAGQTERERVASAVAGIPARSL